MPPYVVLAIAARQTNVRHPTVQRFSGSANIGAISANALEAENRWAIRRCVHCAADLIGIRLDQMDEGLRDDQIDFSDVGLSTTAHAELC